MYFKCCKKNIWRLKMIDNIIKMKTYLESLDLGTLEQFINSNSAFELNEHYKKANINIDIFLLYNKENVIHNYTNNKYLIHGK